jgi:hypothetical protein
MAILREITVDVNGQLESLDQKFQLLAIVLKFDTKIFIKNEIWSSVYSCNKSYYFFNETCTLFYWLFFKTANSLIISSDKAMIEGLSDTD